MEIKDRSHLINQGKIVVRSYQASQGLEYHITYEIEKYFWTTSYIIFCIQYYFNLLFKRQKIYYSGNNKLYDGLFGFLRLRIDSNAGLDIVPEIKNTGLIREVHVYGNSTSVGENNTKSSQHKGIGQKLMKVAEEITLNNNLHKVAVISGIGAREYYKNKCGYHLEGTYMVKFL
jgi:histone acetyltransferase (RNA polymerase elongator complex component)